MWFHSLNKTAQKSPVTYEVILGKIKQSLSDLARASQSLDEFLDALKSAGFMKDMEFGRLVTSGDIVNLQEMAQKSMRKTKIKGMAKAFGIGTGIGVPVGLIHGYGKGEEVGSIYKSSGLSTTIIAKELEGHLSELEKLLKEKPLLAKAKEDLVNAIKEAVYSSGRKATKDTTGQGSPLNNILVMGGGALVGTTAGYAMGFEKALRKYLGKDAEEMIKEASEFSVPWKTIGAGLGGLALGGLAGFGVGKKTTEEKLISQFREAVPRIASITTPAEQNMIRKAFYLGYQRGVQAAQEKLQAEVKKQKKKVAELEKEIEVYKRREKIAEAAVELVKNGVAVNMEDAFNKVAEAMEQNMDLDTLINKAKQKPFIS